jgi:phosphoglycolate phosphatase-like HAD superfamily hydrolase
LEIDVRRLLLFDIDGTLLSTDGAARRAFQRALLEVYGTTGPISTHAFDGKTDPQIARELLGLAGLHNSAVEAGLERLWDAYLRELAHELSQPGHETKLYPGVQALLQRLDQEEVCVALLTGNIARGAALKLASGGIERHFSFGAYGSDRERRSDLPSVALARAEQLTGRQFAGHEVVVIGDTPQDVTCGQSLGVFTVAVATGRYTTNDLLAAGANVALTDLSRTDAVLEILAT